MERHKVLFQVDGKTKERLKELTERLGAANRTAMLEEILQPSDPRVAVAVDSFLAAAHDLAEALVNADLQPRRCRPTPTHIERVDLPVLKVAPEDLRRQLLTVLRRDVFQRKDAICQALGYEPHPSRWYGAIDQLLEESLIVAEGDRRGRRYRLA